MQQRSITIPATVPDDQYRQVLASIARYRAGCRNLFSLYGLAQIAGSHIEEHDEGVRLQPSRDGSRVALQAALQPDTVTRGEKTKGAGVAYAVNVGAATGYEMREHWFTDLYPASLSFVWDSARRQVMSRWAAKDPEFTRASRGWLIAQGSRGLGYFRGVGIELPQATAKPKLTKSSMAVKWDSDIGTVVFAFGSMDPGRWFQWTQIRDGVWPAGTVTINERDGKIRVTLTHERPETTADLDQARVMVVKLSEKQDAMVMSGPDGVFETVPLADILGVLTRLRIQRELWEERRKSAGSVTRSWGNRRAWRDVQTHLDGVTLRRSRMMSDTCHALSRRIASLAQIWRCGKVKLSWLNEIQGQPFARDELIRDAQYKLSQIGGVLNVE